MTYITENEISNNLKHLPWLVSHGGVGSEYLTKILNITYKKYKTTTSNKPFKGCIVHYPYPIKTGPSICIYIYGDIYNSIISQIPRHYDNPSKLHNNINYPHFYNLDELLNHTSSDPFGIYNQICNFMYNKVNYPIILLKYGFSNKYIPLLEKLLQKSINYKFINRKSTFETLNNNIKSMLMQKYEKLKNIVDNTPFLIIRYPNIRYNLINRDILKMEVKLNNLQGNRIKHYIERNGTCIYNERDVNGLYGQLCIRYKNSNKYVVKNFSNILHLTTKFGGCEDPRVILFKHDLYVLFNGLDKNKKRNMYLYNVSTEKVVKLWINNYDISGISKQKNWTPYTYLNNLYLIYSFSELCILKIININNGECNCIKGNPFNHNDNYKYFGGTSLIQWNYPYFIGFAHTRNPHRTVPVIYNCKTLRIERYGNIINFNNPQEAIPWRNKSVQFPYDLNIINDQIILGVEFEDRCPTWIYLEYTSFCKLFSI